MCLEVDSPIWRQRMEPLEGKKSDEQLSAGKMNGRLELGLGMDRYLWTLTFVCKK